MVGKLTALSFYTLRVEEQITMRIITYGTFDTLHFGHIRLLKRARALGSHLTVALSSDEFNFSKGKEAKFSWEQRKLELEGVRYVDDII